MNTVPLFHLLSSDRFYFLGSLPKDVAVIDRYVLLFFAKVRT